MKKTLKTAWEGLTFWLPREWEKAHGFIRKIGLLIGLIFYSPVWVPLFLYMSYRDRHKTRIIHSDKTCSYI